MDNQPFLSRTTMIAIIVGIIIVLIGNVLWTPLRNLIFGPDTVVIQPNQTVEDEAGVTTDSKSAEKKHKETITSEAVTNKGQTETSESNIGSGIFHSDEILIIPNVSTSNYSKIVEQLRNKNGLRNLQPLESGKPVSEIPPGTYFYISAVFLDMSYYVYNSKSDINVQDIQDNRSVKAYPTTDSYFEIHRLSRSNIYLLAYVTDETASSLTSSNRSNPKFVILSPKMWGHFNNIAMIPISRIHRMKEREIELNEKERLSIVDAEIQ